MTSEAVCRALREEMLAYVPGDAAEPFLIRWLRDEKEEHPRLVFLKQCRKEGRPLTKEERRPAFGAGIRRLPPYLRLREQTLLLSLGEGSSSDVFSFLAGALTDAPVCRFSR